MANEDFIIKQLSVFLENKPGSLARIVKVMDDAKVNVLALSLAEAGDFGVIRMLVKNPDDARKKLHEKRFTVSLTNVLGIRIRDGPGLYEIARILGDSSVNIEYAYACTSTIGPMLILRVSDIEKAIVKIVEVGGGLVEKKYLE